MLGTEFCQMVSVIFSSDILLANRSTQLARILGAKCEVKPLYTATLVAFCPCHIVASGIHLKEASL